MGKFSKIEPDAPTTQVIAPDVSQPYALSPEEAARQKAPPISDVSAMVGLIGLLGLTCWVLICRNWPAIADMLGLPGPRMVLSGPNASLVALVFSAVPMAIWSLVVNKVHRNPSTGIEWALNRPIADIIQISITKLVGLWVTWGLIGFVYCLERWYWAGDWLFAMHVLGGALVPMVLLSAPYVLWLDRKLVQPRDAAWHFGAMVLGRDAYDKAEVGKHLRSWAVKGYFSAFMISILPGGFGAVVGFDWQASIHNPAAMANFLISVLFLIDVQIGSVGYLLTLKPFDSQIRSANPYLAGWVAALLCYPGFAAMSPGGPLDYKQFTADWSFWMAGYPTLQWIWLSLMVVLTGIYAWATVAFGIRFSNLTYRGVVTNGPFRFTRHPAYLSKNLFWWASTLPFLATTHSVVDEIRNTCLLAGVSAVYYWRAKTEERHLCAEDAKYRAYSAWMQANAPITRGISALAHWVIGSRAQPQVQPAE